MASSITPPGSACWTDVYCYPLVDVSVSYENLVTEVTPHVAAHWHQLASKLGLNEHEIENIMTHHNSNSFGAANAVFRKWTEQKGKNATSSDLCSALVNIGLNSEASEIEKKLVSNPNYLSAEPHSPADSRSAESTETLGAMSRTALEQEYTNLQNTNEDLLNDFQYLLDAGLQKKNQELQNAVQEINRMKYLLNIKFQELYKARQKNQELTLQLQQLNEEMQQVKTRNKALQHQLSERSDPAAKSHSSTLPAAEIGKVEPGKISGNAFLDLYEQGLRGLDSLANQEHITLIKSKIFPYWEVIAAHLGFDMFDISSIEISKKSESAEQKLSDVIQKWIQTTGRDARNYRNLAKAVYDALNQEGECELAIEVCCEIIKMPPLPATSPADLNADNNLIQ